MKLKMFSAIPAVINCLIWGSGKKGSVKRVSESYRVLFLDVFLTDLEGLEEVFMFV